MKLNDFFKEELVILDLVAANKGDAIEKMAKLIYENNIVESYDEYLKAVLNREKEFTTGVGLGVAIPHGKDVTVKQSCFAFAKLENPINWDSLDGNDVEIVFMLAIEENSSDNSHLKMLSTIAVALMDEENVKELKNVNNIEELKKKINKMVEGE